MTLTPYQIVAPVVSVLAVTYAWNLVGRQKKMVLEACLWTVFWGVIVLIALNPGYVSYLSQITGIADQESAVIVTFVGVLFFMVFYLVIRLEALEQRHAKIVRMLALRDANLGKPEDSEKL